MNEKRKRYHRIQVRLSDDEYDYFCYNRARTGLTTESYLRQLISDKTPKTKEMSQLDKEIVAQLYAIGNNLNQIARRVNDSNILSVDKFNKAVDDFKQIMQRYLEQR